VVGAPRPAVSIVVPLAGDPASALRCLQGIAAQEAEPAHEVIVVDDASCGLDALLASLGGDVEIVRSELALGLAGALRAGMERAQGEIVVALRDAAAPLPGWLAPLAGALEDPSVGLAASVTAGAGPAGASPLAALSVAARAEELRGLAWPEVPAPLAFAALAVGVAERGVRVVAVPESVIAPAGAERPAVRRQPPGAPELTIVIPTLDAASERVRACVERVHACTDAPYEIVIVDNGAPPQGFSAPVNAGVRAADTPYVAVMNDDVEVLPGWWEPLRAALQQGALVACPKTVEGGMRDDFPAWCFAIARARMERLEHAPGELFDPSLVVWYQDTDLLRRLRGAGTPPVVVDASRIRHGFSRTLASADPALRAWIEAQIAADRARFLKKHPDAVLSRRPLAAA
jgi:GT2 family glycosyltransferase